MNPQKGNLMYRQNPYPFREPNTATSQNDFITIVSPAEPIAGNRQTRRLAKKLEKKKRKAGKK